MKRSDVTGQRLAAIFAMGCVLLNYPIAALFSGPDEVGGIPVLFAYVLGAWVLLIALMAWAIERPGE
jgi:predicted permease